MTLSTANWVDDEAPTKRSTRSCGPLRIWLGVRPLDSDGRCCRLSVVDARRVDGISGRGVEVEPVHIELGGDTPG